MFEKKKIPVHSSISEGDFHLQYGYSLKLDKLKLTFVIFLSIISFGTIFFLIFWSELLRRKFLYEFCEFPDASHFLIKHCDQKFEIVKLNQIKVAGKSWRTFRTRLLSYYLDEYSESIKIFVYNLGEYDKDGLTDTVAKENKLIYGDCLIDIPVPSIFSFFMSEIMNPYFVFQFFSVVVWMLEKYVMFAVLIFVICIVTAISNLISSRGNLQNLKEIVYHECEVKVLRKNADIVQQHEIRLNFDDNLDKTNLKGNNSKFKAINSKDITPGDIIKLEPNSILPCDCILLSGEVLMNECKLTGETVPIIKFPFSSNKINNINGFDPSKNKSNILFCGTEIMQVKGEEGEDILGLAWQIGFHSSKGQLIRAILFPKDQPFKFFEESIKFLLLISFLSVFGFILVLPKLIEVMPTPLLILKFFDIITISVPPSLPAAINIGISLTLDRLKKKNIFCIAPYKTVIGGRINMVCFDKTGTLTEDQMKFKGVAAYSYGEENFKELNFEKNKDELQPQNDDKSLIEKEEMTDNILMLMATCHNLAPFQNSNDNSIKIFGDPMEAQMFEHSLAIFSIGNDTILQKDREYKILKKFEFTSEHQRMSAILKIGENEKYLKYFLKGNPELIKKMISSNKLPFNYDQTLDELSQKGYRILAITYKDIKIEGNLINYPREYFEENLNFLGFLLFENPIKPETMSTIQGLNEADLQIKMITGDNPITAINVGREIGIFDPKSEILLSELDQDGKVFWKKIDQAAAYSKNILPNNENSFLNERKVEKEISMPIIEKKNNYNTFEEEEKSSFLDLFSRLSPSSNIIITGPIFEILYPVFNKNLEILKNFLFANVKILARMKPSQKSTFIFLLQKAGNSVAMVGDGANDCGALKQADIGLALSQTEASITAPFTSKDLNISSIIEILKDSRAGLVTTFQCFKFMVFYSLTQFFTTILLYFNYSTLSDAQFLYIDFFIVCPLFVTMSMTASAEKLDKKRPDASLLGNKTICSVVGMLFLQIVGQLIVLKMCSSQINIEKNIEFFEKNGRLKFNSVEADALFSFTIFLYIGGILSLSFAKKYKKEVHTNLPYTFNLVIIFFYSIVMIFERKFRYWSLEVSDDLSREMKIEISLLGVSWMGGLVVLQNFIEFWFRNI